MTDQSYMSKERYDMLSRLEPTILTEEDKKEMYAYIVFNIITNIALAKQRGVDIEKDVMAKQLLTLPNQILKFIADSMIEKMKTTTPINVRVLMDETFRDPFIGTVKKFYAKNPHLRSVLKLRSYTRRVNPEKPPNIMSYFISRIFKPEKKLNTINVLIGVKRESNDDEHDYERYRIAIKNYFFDIIAEKDLPIDNIVFEYYNEEDD